MSDLHTVVLRVWLPDLPGALGKVATAIGEANGDVLAIEILEVGAGRVIDELAVALPSATCLDDMVARVHAIDGVSVEHVRPIVGNHNDGGLLALALGAKVAEAQPNERLHVLVDAAARLTEADWVMACRDQEAVCTIGEAPSADFVSSLLVGSSHLGQPHTAMSEDMFWAALPEAGLWIAAGREGRLVHERERVRLDLFLRVADALLAADGRGDCSRCSHYGAAQQHQ